MQTGSVVVFKDVAAKVGQRIGCAVTVEKVPDYHAVRVTTPSRCIALLKLPFPRGFPDPTWPQVVEDFIADALTGVPA